MARKNLKNIFLSASIPLPGREFYGTADVLAIRDAVKALVTIAINDYRIIWGGHPAITPLIRQVMSSMQSNVQEHVTLYQSRFFENQFPSDNFEFENVILTPNLGSIPESIDEMRLQMIGDNAFQYGIFIGGMQGIIDEFNLFKKLHPQALVFPIASTGAAAKELYYSQKIEDKRLLENYAYLALFTDLLSNQQK